METVELYSSRESAYFPSLGGVVKNCLAHVQNGLHRALRMVGLKRRYCAYVTSIHHLRGNSFCTSVPSYLVSDRKGRSRLFVFEDDRPLTGPHAIHEEIETKGAGRYSHWGNWVMFSSSDNTNPLTNGRIYTVREL
jgi:hypothetical protein